MGYQPSLSIVWLTSGQLSNQGRMHQGRIVHIWDWHGCTWRVDMSVLFMAHQGDGLTHQFRCGLGPNHLHNVPCGNRLLVS